MAVAASKTKGNPASHRMSNDNLKARRKRSWARGQKRKEARREAQAKREAANKILFARILDSVRGSVV